jgi:mRNA interferase MazF
VKRREIYFIDLTHDRFGHEESGNSPRPAIIFSNDVLNGNSSWGTIIVVPVSTSPNQSQRQYGVLLPRGSGGLTSDSVALCHQITTIDRRRVRNLIGMLDVRLMNKVDAEVRTILYL